MQVKELIAILETLSPDAEVFIKHFGDVEADENDTFHDLAHTEIEQVNGRDALAIATH